MQNQDVPRSPKPMTIGLPTRPGAYWFQGQGMSPQVLVNVRRKNGELTGWLFGHDVPVAELNGYWRGPIPLSTGPGHPTAS